MKKKAFHIRLSPATISKAVSTILLQEKGKLFVPVLKGAKTNLETLLLPIGLVPPDWVLESSQMEILLDRTTNNTIILRNALEPFYGEAKNDVIDGLVFFTEDPSVLEGLLRSAFPDGIGLFSWKESYKIEELEEGKGELSPNGKLLENPALRQAARELYDDKVRTRVRESSSGTYQLQERAIKQGLWLESLSSDVMKRFCSKVWTGQFFGVNEVDVVGTLAGYTILVECKDTHYGLNDLYVTGRKALEVNAEITLVITTRHVHKNVLNELPRVKDGIPDCEMLKVIQEDKSRKIESAFSRILADLDEGYSARWMRRWPIPTRFQEF